MASASAEDSQQGQDGPLTARLLPHTGWVFVDKTRAGAWLLTHIFTREQVRLAEIPPVHQYSLTFDDDGFGMVCEIGEDGAEIEGSISFVEDRLSGAWSASGTVSRRR